jgi:uncharacterized protein (TIGR02145 family)
LGYQKCWSKYFLRKWARFTFTEAQNAYPKGWRLPTKNEFVDLYNNGNTVSASGVIFGTKLNFPRTHDYEGRGSGYYHYNGQNRLLTFI